jgi:glycosyltransferase involved in cell wall biosynthesis
MTILHLLDSMAYADGCARVVSFLAREQVRSGYTVHVVAGGGDAGELFAPSVLAPELLAELGHRGRSTAGFIRGVRTLHALLRAIRPDIVHAHHYYAANIAALAMHLRRARLVQTVHGSIGCGGMLPHHPGGRIIAVSNATRVSILRCSPRIGDRITVVHNGVEFPGLDADFSASPPYRQALERKPGTRAIAFVGRFVEQKGWRVLLDALALLPAQDLLLLAAGAGPDDAALRAILAERGIPHVLFGELRDVRPVLELADILAFPSLPIEGFPTVLLEAGLCDTAVVASNTDGVPELVTDGTSGLLFPPGDARALAEALRRMMTDDALRSACGRTLGALVRERFTVRRMADATAAVYAAALGRD